MKNYKIFIAEDDNNVREMYKVRLELDDFKVIAVADGGEALSMIRKEKPDLALLDIMMPHMTGLEVLKTLKEDPETKEIPVLIFSALSGDLMKDKALLLGAEDYIVKSQVSLEDVVVKIKNILNIN